VSAGVGAAASGGMTAGSAAANVGSSAVKGYRTQVDQMAGRSADQAVAYLSEFFARQGGIPQEKVIQAKRAGQGTARTPRPAFMEGAMQQKRNMLVWPVMLSLVVVSVAVAAAQSASISGMYVFPKRGQPPEQQQQDEMQCHSSAVEMTGFNPSAPPSVPPPSQGAPTGSGARGAVRGAAGGAALGAAVGAIGGDAGKGAAMGAAGGGIVGGVRGRRQGKQQQAAQQQAAQTQQQAHLQEYQRAFSACMDARGYSVK